MSVAKNIEEKIWNPSQLEKLEVLRHVREVEKFQKNMAMPKTGETSAKRELKEGDKVRSHAITSRIDHGGMGIILKTTKNHKKGILCDVKFGRYVFEGVPANILRIHNKREIGKNIEYWRDNFRTYIDTKMKFSEMPTMQLLKLFQATRSSCGERNHYSDAEVNGMRMELETRGHVPRKSDRSHRGKTERIKWSEFSKQL